MSPFAQYLYELRTRHKLRQAELAKALGYEQSYISALEVGTKGPPTREFVDQLARVFNLSPIELVRMQAAIEASQRKLIIATDASPEVYWLLKDLRDEVGGLCAAQIRLIRDILKLRDLLLGERLRPRREEIMPQSDLCGASEVV